MEKQNMNSKSMWSVAAFGLMFVAASVLSGCKKTSGNSGNVMNVQINDTSSVADTTIYGVCGEGTTMHTLEILADDGSVRKMIINLDDSISDDVQGGLLNGDRLAVIAEVVYGDTIAKKVINLTTLQGKWVSLDKNFEIRDGGVVQSNLDAESNPWTNWRIFNGQLLLNADTFDVVALGADSLLLENRNGIFGYKRLQK